MGRHGRRQTMPAVVLAALACLAVLYGPVPRMPSAFVGSTSIAPRAWPSSQSSAGVAMRAKHGPTVKKKDYWVEPTIPKDLYEEAKAEGFRLRPIYNFMKKGFVISDRMSKSRMMLFEYFKYNTKYKIFQKRMKRVMYHDEYEISKLGDVVLIAPFRKLSRGSLTGSWKWWKSWMCRCGYK